jgi:hypothetical protein
MVRIIIQVSEKLSIFLPPVGKFCGHKSNLTSRRGIVIYFFAKLCSSRKNLPLKACKICECVGTALNSCQELMPDPFGFKTAAARVGKNQDSATDRLAKYVKARALALIADIVAAVCHRRSSDLSSGFGCKNNSHSGKANGSLALLPSLVILPRIEQMSKINARPLCPLQQSQRNVDAPAELGYPSSN